MRCSVYIEAMLKNVAATFVQHSSQHLIQQIRMDIFIIYFFFTRFTCSHRPARHKIKSRSLEMCPVINSETTALSYKI